METLKPFVIGVDLGGTNTVFGIVDRKGEIVYEDSIRTQTYPTVEEFVDAGVSCLKPLIAQAGGIGQIQAMGIGAPNGNYYSGTIEFAPNLPWKGIVPLAEMFSKALGIPVGLTNDANAAAMGGRVRTYLCLSGWPSVWLWQDWLSGGLLLCYWRGSYCS